MEVLLKMGKYTGITSILAIPADREHYVPVGKMPPIDKQVVIGTPGTISKWMTAKKLSMSFMKILVFDEADHMLAEVNDACYDLNDIIVFMFTLLSFSIVMN